MIKVKLLSLTVALALFANAASAADEQAESQQVLAVEKAWTDAEVSHDEAVLNRILDDRFVLNSSSGKPGAKRR